jgi:hypothetical protein
MTVAAQAPYRQDQIAEPARGPRSFARPPAADASRDFGKSSRDERRQRCSRADAFDDAAAIAMTFFMALIST